MWKQHTPVCYGKPILQPGVAQDHEDILYRSIIIRETIRRRTYSSVNQGLEKGDKSPSAEIVAGRCHFRSSSE